MVAGVFAAVAIGLLGMVVSVPVQLPADGHEYLGTVVSLLESGSLKYDPADLEASAERISPETSFVHSDVGQNAKRNRWGDRMWGSHSYYVALVALPFVALMAAKGFLVLNVVFFMAMLAAVYASLRGLNGRGTSLVLALALLFLSGVPAYIFFINSEMMLMAALAGGILFGLRFQAIPAAVLLAIATAIKPPLVLVILPLALWHFVHKRNWRTVAVMFIVFAAAGAPQLGYYFYNFGDYQSVDLSPERIALVEERREAGAIGGLNPIERTTRYMSFDRFRVFFFSPDMGMLWFFPAMIWCVLRSGRPLWFTGIWLLTAVGVTLLTLSTPLLYTTDGGIRYATLVYPMLLFLPGRWRHGALDYAAMGFAAFFGTALVLDAAHTIRHPQQVMGKAFPSMAMARSAGVPIYPQTLYHTGRRWTRDTVFDYVDNEQFVRAKRVSLMVRNVEPGEIIVKLAAPSQYPDSTVRGCQYGGACGETVLSAGRVSTLLIPIEASDLMSVPYPEYFRQTSRSAQTARVELHFSELGLRSSRGDLRWQTRFHENPHPYLYPAGPRILAVYPSRDWILQAWASDGLDPAFDTELNERFDTSGPGVFLHLQEEQGIEGTGGLAIENRNESEMLIEVLGANRGVLDTPLRMYETLEVAGWTALTELVPVDAASETPLRVALFVRWFDAEGRTLADTPVWTYAESVNLGYRSERVAVPEGAATMTLGLRFLNARGAFFVDDLTASWFKDVWDNQRPGVQSRR